jgi:tetratricopeptide (TPR) repeat protein
MKKEIIHHRIRSFCIISILVIPIFTACTDAETYFKRASSHHEKGNYDQAIADFSKVIEIDPRSDETYANRGVAYFIIKEYEEAWDDVYTAQNLGYKVPPRFLKVLREASGRQQ